MPAHPEYINHLREQSRRHIERDKKREKEKGVRGWRVGRGRTKSVCVCVCVRERERERERARERERDEETKEGATFSCVHE